MQSIQADEDFSANTDAVKQSIQQELMATGRHREQTAEANATAFAAYFATRAHMLGETPQALYQRTRIKFAPEGGFSFTDGQYTQALAAQPPNGWVHASTGADAAAMWNGQSDAQAVFWTELGGKLQADAPELAGYSHSIGQSAINHIKSRHTDAQTEASRGQLPVTDADIASIPEIVTNYDAIRTDLKGKLGQPMLAFAKRTEDGVLLYLAAGTKKRRNLGAVSMWRYPPSVDVQQVLEHAVAPDPYAQSVMAAWADDSANLENAIEQQTAEAKQFSETEAALGGKPAYEQAAHSPELNALRELAQMDDLFALPKSHATDVVQAMADIDKSFSFQGKRENIDTDGRTAYDFATKDGETFTIYTRDNEAGAMLPFGHYGYAQSDDYTGRPAFAQRPGENLDGASDGRSDVWVDVSQLKGKGNGAKVYAAAADFAHNTDAVFVGDPNSLSNDGMMRRPIQMLAAAMRWGTTDHIAPHPRQFAGDSSIGVPALQWAKGDTLGNLRKLIDLSLKLEEDSPHGLDITYDPQTNSYRDGNGIPIDRSGIASVAGLSRRESLSDPTRQSGRSNARAAVLRALLREESAGGRGSDGRPVGLLERLSWSVRRDGTLAEQERNLRALFQNDGSAPRGLFDPDSFTIALLSGSDLSTTLHEGAHFFFENDIALAGEIVAEAQAFGYDGLSAGQKQLLADTSTLLSWHGLQGDTAEQLMHWNALEPEAKRAMHERTAESFERYLLEGKAQIITAQKEALAQAA
jgi:hypothetical protein